MSPSIKNNGVFLIPADMSQFEVARFVSSEERRAVKIREVNERFVNLQCSPFQMCMYSTACHLCLYLLFSVGLCFTCYVACALVLVSACVWLHYLPIFVHIQSMQ